MTLPADPTPIPEGAVEALAKWLTSEIEDRAWAEYEAENGLAHVAPLFRAETAEQREEAHRLRGLISHDRAALSQAHERIKELEGDRAAAIKGLEEIGAYDGADWDVEGVCGHACDVLEALTSRGATDTTTKEGR
jgi:hypothetical protein